MKRAVAVLAPFALLLAACGGDDGGGDGAGGGGGGGGGASTAAWCDVALQLEDDSDVLDDVDPFDPDAIRAAYSEFRDLVEEARAAAPAEIRDDVATLADGVVRIDEELAAADYNFLDVDLSFLEEMGAEMDAASDRVDAFNARECGFEIDDDLGDLDDLDDLGDVGDTAPGSGTVRDQLVAELVSSGFSEDEARCVADNLDISQMAAADTDPTAMLSVFEDCDIDFARLAELGG